MKNTPKNRSVFTLNIFNISREAYSGSYSYYYPYFISEVQSIEGVRSITLETEFMKEHKTFVNFVT